MRKRIMVIDQSPTIQVLLATYLQMKGHTVITCSTVREALEALAGLQQPPDVIFVTIDYQQEAYRIFEETQRHEQYRQIRFVALVLPQEQAEIQRSLQGRVISYLHKPFHIQEVFALVSTEEPTSVAPSGAPAPEKKW